MVICHVRYKAGGGYGNMIPGKTGALEPISEIAPKGIQIPHKGPHFSELPFYLRWPPAFPAVKVVFASTQNKIICIYNCSNSVHMCSGAHDMCSVILSSSSFPSFSILLLQANIGGD
jgi:hypothetical protein